MANKVSSKFVDAPNGTECYETYFTVLTSFEITSRQYDEIMELIHHKIEDIKGGKWFECGREICRSERKIR